MQSVLAKHSTHRLALGSQMPPPPIPPPQLALLRQATQRLVVVLQYGLGRAHCMSVEQIGTHR
jgi:hypothetical protein